jgi:cell division protein FtsW
MAKSISRSPNQKKLRSSPVAKIRSWIFDNFAAESIDFYRLTGLTIFLVIFGVVMVLSSSSIDSLVANRDAYYVAGRQGLFAIGGLVIMSIIAAMKIGFVRSKAPLIILGCMALQLAVPLFGFSVNGNKNWISILGLVIQPSEFLKVGLIVYMGYLISRNEFFSSEDVPVIAPVLIAGGISLVLVMLGGDLGTAIIFAIIIFGTLSVAGAPLRPLLIAVTLLAAGAVAAVSISPSRMLRIVAWLNPDSVVSEAFNWQYEHGTWALAAGGIFGVGLGNSKMKWSWIPEVENDFIFAVIGEELGLIGALVVIGLFSLMAWTLIRIMIKSRDPFARFTILGVAIWFIGQSCVNLAVVLGLLPVLGVPLPLISAGGSSLISTLAAIGLVLAFEKQTHREVSGGARR